MHRIFIVLLIAIFLAPDAKSYAKKILTVASTTSLDDSGFYALVLPGFEKKYSAKVHILAVGSGQAVRIAKDGNADLLFIHDRESEEAFIASGNGIKRIPVFFNYFILAGPARDPVKTKGLSIKEAFNKISGKKAGFISRGDLSGTDKKEKKIWQALNFIPSGKWYIESGSGMEITLRIADEKQFYCFTDSATFQKNRERNKGLKMLVWNDPEMMNPYSIVLLSPEKFRERNHALALSFVEYLHREEVREKIKNYGRAEYGESLFYLFP